MTTLQSAEPLRRREVSIEEAGALALPMHDRGTMIVIQGPRFSTRAESRFFSAQGWDIIGMTQHPEAALARELEMCFGNISLVTDYDVGVEGEIEAVTHEEVIRVFEANIGRLRDLLTRIIKRIPEERDCECATALAHARFEV